jgi:hypothetical protein
MALQDREYMRERRDNDKVLHFRPAPQKTSVFTIVLYVVAALYLLYQAALWWQNKLPSTKPAAASPVAVPSSGNLGADVPRALEPQSQRTTQTQPNQPPAPGTVSKCVVNGKVTYSDAACPKDAVVGSVKLPPPVPVDAYQQARAAPVPTAALQQKVGGSESQPTLHTPSQAAPAKSAECKLLDELVKQIDIRALQPQSLQQQDLLREDRKKARDRQFFLGC